MPQFILYYVFNTLMWDLLAFKDNKNMHFLNFKGERCTAELMPSS